MLDSHHCIYIQYVALLFWLKYIKKIWFHTVGKGRSTLIAFSDSYGYSFLTLYQNSTKGIFLKVSCNVELKTIYINKLFIFYYIKSFGLS